MALAIARLHRAKVRALYVSRHEVKKRPSISHRREEAVLKDIVDLGERYGIAVETVMQPRIATEKAICNEANKGASLVVMGVHQRPGKELFYGSTVNAVLFGCHCPVALIAIARTQLDDAQQEARRASMQQATMTSDDAVAAQLVADAELFAL